MVRARLSGLAMALLTRLPQRLHDSAARQATSAWAGRWRAW